MFIKFCPIHPEVIVKTGDNKDDYCILCDYDTKLSVFDTNDFDQIMFLIQELKKYNLLESAIAELANIYKYKNIFIQTIQKHEALEKEECMQRDGWDN